MLPSYAENTTPVARTSIHLADEDIITDDTPPTKRRAGLRPFAASRQHYTSHSTLSIQRGRKRLDRGTTYSCPSSLAENIHEPLEFIEYNSKRKAKAHLARKDLKAPRVSEDAKPGLSGCSDRGCDDAAQSSTEGHSQEVLTAVPPSPHRDGGNGQSSENLRTRQELLDVIKPFVMKAPDYMQCRMTAGCLQGLHNIVSCTETYQKRLDRSSELCTANDAVEGPQPQLSDVSKIPKIQVRIAVLLFLAHVDVGRRETGDSVARTRLKHIGRLLVPELLKEVKAIAAWLKSASTE